MKNYNLICESIAILSADLWKDVYNKTHGEEGGYQRTARKIVRLAREFEERLGWQEGDKRDYIGELGKYEDEIRRNLYTAVRKGEGTREIWMRVGMRLTASEEEMGKVLEGDFDTLHGLLDGGKFDIDGETYIPAVEIEDYNARYGTHFKEKDVDF